MFYPRFSELEDLVPTIIEFTNAAVLLLDDQFDAKELEKYVGSNVYIAIATALIQNPLEKIENQNEIKRVSEQILQLHSAKCEILLHLQGRMKQIAPNLNSLIGSAAAANVLSAAGSINKLAVMPACNIQVLGMNRNFLPGMSNVNRFSSFLSKTSFVENSGLLKKKAVRMLAGKVALAARIDMFHEYPDGSKGAEFLQNLQKSLEKSSEKADSNEKNPLPVPKELAKPHRGGKRIRAIKNKFQLTEIGKQANRIRFGTEEQEEFRDTGHAFGMLGQSGKINVKSHKKKSKASKNQNFLPNGTTSCFAFCGQNEVKLDNPQILSSSQSKYFDSTTGFSTVLLNKKKS